MYKNERDDFAAAVFEIAKLIPPGRVTSYGAIARAAGGPGLSRMVGCIMAKCGEDIPAHRVLNSQGELSARRAFGPGDEMEKLLEAEGVVVRNNRIKDWKHVFWDPLTEIGII